jgi:hypothetical protein
MQFEALVANEETKEGREATPFDNVVGSATDELETKFSKARTYARRLGATLPHRPMATFSSMGSTTSLMKYVAMSWLQSAILNYRGLEFFESRCNLSWAGLPVFPRKRAFLTSFWDHIAYLGTTFRSTRA